MTATIIDLRTRRPLVRVVPDGRDEAHDEVIRRLRVVGRVAGMPDSAAALLAAHGLRRYKNGDSVACVIAWAREFARDFMRHSPGPGAA
jgi:hypothetical protein